MRIDAFMEKAAWAVLGSLRLKRDFNEGWLWPEGLKVLFVEGDTDSAFIDRVRRPDVVCRTVGSALKAQEALREDYARAAAGARGDRNPDFSKTSRKALIMALLRILSDRPEFFSFPKGSGNWPVYGLIDRDWEEVDPYLQLPRLFITDTHDIETLMLSTDRGILGRLGALSVPEEVRRRALWLAGQMAAFRGAFFEEGTIRVRELADEEGFVDYAAFTDNGRIVLEKLIGFLRTRQEERIPPQKLLRAGKRIAAAMKKQLDPSGTWKEGFESFPAEPDGEFWLRTNGHDILSAVCFFLPEARKTFSRKGWYSLNREFEFALVALYDLGAFAGTDLHEKLAGAELLDPGAR